MSDDRHDPLADVINVLAAPIAGGLRSMEQFQRGVSELFRAVDNLNTTLENLNETSTRVNALIADIEEPVRAMIPQLTRSVKAADEMTRLLEAPVKAAAPNIEAVAATLSSPGFATLPNQLGDFMTVINDVSRRLAPLTQLAEGAGGLFGGLRMPGMPTPPKSAAASASTTESDAEPAAKKSVARKTTAKKTTAKRSAARKATPKKRSTS